MATVTRYLSRSALSFTRRIPTRRKPTCSVIQRRPFHSTLIRSKDEDEKEEKDSSTEAPRSVPSRGYFLESEAEEEYNLLSPEERAKVDADGRALHEHFTSPQPTMMSGTTTILAPMHMAISSNTERRESTLDWQHGNCPCLAVCLTSPRFYHRGLNHPSNFVSF